MTFAHPPSRRLPYERRGAILHCILLVVLAAAPVSAEIAVAPLAASGAGTCGLTSAGGVKCWGSNEYGRLGDGTTTTRLTAVDVSGLTSGVTALAAAGFHTCGLTSAGGVKCWGLNDYGQLGDGTTMTRLTAVDVSGLTSGVTALAASGYSTCALTSAGGVKCWGYNGDGQLGDGTTTTRLTAVDVSGLTSGVTALAAGGYHTCGLTSAGGIKCLGFNGFGQLGDGTTTMRLTAVDVSGLTSGLTALVAGGAHTCGLTSAGGVKCWGYNNTGQLGSGNQIDSLIPTDAIGFGPVCGNGVVEPTEACDDGNGIAGDCCTPSCELEGDPACPFTIRAAVGTLENQGASVAATATRLAVGGAAFGGGQGAAYLYDETGALLCRFANPSPPSSSTDLFGRKVAFLGSDVLVTAPHDDTYGMQNGVAYLFDGTTCALVRTFHKPSPGIQEHFGSGLAVLPDGTFLVGAETDSTAAHFSGAIYRFNAAGTLLAAIPNPTGIAEETFGNAIAVVGSNVVVSATGATVSGSTTAGKAYVLDGTSYSVIRTLVSPNRTTGGRFGQSLAAHGLDLLVGAHTDSVAGTVGGAAYRFNMSTGQLVQTYTKPVPVVFDYCGLSVASLGSTVALGCPHADAAFTDGGEVHIFDADSGLRLQTFTNPGTSSGAEPGGFGWALVAAAGRLAVGAVGNDVLGVDSGAVYLVDPCGNGTRSTSETCDDGNNAAGDCCAATCLAEAPGGSCTDGNACTQTDQCNGAGACTGTNPVVCTALDQCHDPGTCNSVSGTCSNPSKADGSVCSDANLCTQTDTCQAGACAGANPVVCTALDQCHDAGICSPASGICSNPNKANGAPCSDGDACTQTDGCQAGSCTGANPVVCTSSDQCHVAGTCNSSTGECTDPPAPNGTTCDDGNTCTGDDACSAGTCAGDSQICGDGTVQTECSEQCDDGGLIADDGCDATCRFEACPPQPRAGCRLPVVSAKAQLKMKDVTDDTKDQMQWQWSTGEATTKADYGNPLATDAYRLCIYDAGVLRSTTSIPAGGSCAGKSCWKESTKSFAYQDKELTPDGAAQLKLAQGEQGKVKLGFKAKGVLLDVPPLAALAGPVRVQLVRSGGAQELCWEAVYDAPFLKNDGVSFIDKAN